MDSWNYDNARSLSRSLSVAGMEEAVRQRDYYQSVCRVFESAFGSIFFIFLYFYIFIFFNSFRINPDINIDKGLGLAP